MKRYVLAILAAVLIFPGALSLGGCSSGVGFGIDTFASVPSPTSVKSPDDAEVVIYLLIVKIVSPAVEIIQKQHEAGQVSDARFVELMNYAGHVGRFARAALDGASHWRQFPPGSPPPDEFTVAFGSALAAAHRVVDAPEVKR